jgi:hypothetical protein
VLEIYKLRKRAHDETSESNELFNRVVALTALDEDLQRNQISLVWDIGGEKLPYQSSRLREIIMLLKDSGVSAVRSSHRDPLEEFRKRSPNAVDTDGKIHIGRSIVDELMELMPCEARFPLRLVVFLERKRFVPKRLIWLRRVSASTLVAKRVGRSQ